MHYRWLDRLVGFVTGLVLDWFIYYGVISCVSYLTPRSVDYYWCVVAGCAITLLISTFIWNRVRLKFSTLANSMLAGSLLLSGLILYVFYNAPSF